MKRRWALRFLLFVGAAVAAVVLVLRTPWAGRELCATTQSLLERLLRQPVELGTCEVDPLAARVTVDGVRLGDGARVPKLSAARLLVELSPLAIGRALAIDEIRIESPRLEWRVPEPGPAKEEAPSGECLGFLERVALGTLEITDGSALVELPGGERVELAGLRLAVTGERRNLRARLALAGGKVSRGEEELPVDGLDATVALDAGASSLAIGALRVSAAGATLEAEGAIRRLCDPVFDLAGTVRADLPRAAAALAPSLENVRGAAELDWTLRGEAAAPAATAALRVRGLAFDDLEPGDVDARASLEGETLRLEELVWPIGGGRAVVSGELLLRERLPATVDVRTERLDFHRLMAALPVKNTPVVMTIDSTHHLEGHLLDGLRLAGRSELRIADFHVRSEPWHASAGRTIVEVPGTATLVADVVLTDHDIALESARASFGPGTQLQIAARLAFSTREGMYIGATSPRFDLAHVGGHVAGIPLGGAGAMEAVIAGPYPDPTIEGRIDMEGARLFSAQLGRLRSDVRSRPAEGALSFANTTGEYGGSAYDAQAELVLGGDPSIEAELALRAGSRLGDLFAATAGLVSPLEWLRDNLDATVEAARATVSGPLPNVSARARIEARAARLLDRPFDRLAATLVAPDITELRFEEVELTRGKGRALAVGAARFPAGATPTLDVEVDAAELPLRDLMGAFGDFAELRGEAGARARLSGPVDALDLRGELFAEHVQAHGVELDASRLSLEPQAGRVVIRGPVGGAGTLAGSVELVPGLPFDAALRLDVPELARFVPASLTLDGSVRGTATASGSLAALTDAAGSVRLEALELESGDYRVRSTGAVSMRYAGASFELDGVRLVGENTQLSLAGERDRAGRLDLQAHGTFDARILDSLVPQIEHAAGVVRITASVTGTGERPVLVGSAEIERGAFRVKPLPIQVERLGGKLAFSQNQVVVEDASLIVNGGASRLRGSVSLRSWAPDVFDLTLQGERVSWRKPAEWPAVVTGRVHLGGSWPRSLLLTGELDVDRLRYTKDLELEKAVLDFRRRVTQPPGADDEEFVRLDLDLVGGPDMRVDNNLLRARLAFVAPPGGGKPRLKLVGTNVRLGLLGSVELLDGVGFFRGNEYRLTHGVVELEERTRIDPHFDLTAETEVREYQVVVHAHGKLDDGRGGNGLLLELSSEPMLAQADIITLLTFGITSKDLDRGGNALTGAGVAAEALLTVSGLDEHVKRWLPDSQLLQEPEFSITSQYSEVTGQVEPMATFEARLLTDELRLKAAAPFSSAKGRRASAEYRFGERLSTQLIWENEETGYSAGDLGVDVKLRWEWE